MIRNAIKWLGTDVSGSFDLGWVKASIECTRFNMLVTLGLSAALAALVLL